MKLKLVIFSGWLLSTLLLWALLPESIRSQSLGYTASLECSGASVAGDCQSVAETNETNIVGPIVERDSAGFKSLAADHNKGGLAIASSYTETPPNINGSVGFGEWEISNKIEFGHGFITVLNDTTRLYILVDVLDDTGNDTTSPKDYFWLTFDVNKDNAITPNVDLNYGTHPTSGNMRYQYYLGPSSWSGLQSDFKSSKARGFGCFFSDGSFTITLFPFSINCSSHRVWEFGIDLLEIGAKAGDTVKMGLRVSSPNPSFTDDTPANFSSDFSNLIEVSLDSSPSPLPYPDPGASIGLESDAIEVTQAIQDRQNSLPLVQDKSSVARVYVDVSGVAASQTAIVYLYGSKGGVDLPGSPLSTLFNAPASINRSQLNDTANFLLPSSWLQGTVDFEARVVDKGGGDESSTPLPLTYTAKDKPVYWVVPINGGSAASPVLPSNSEIASQQSYLEATFPVADVRFVRKSWQVIGPNISVANTINELNQYHSNTVLAWVLSVIFTGQAPFELPDQIYGFNSSGGGISDPTWIGANGYVARGFRGTSREGTMAHEINHNLDRSVNGTWGRHAPNGCGAGGPDSAWPYANDDIQEVGFDTRLPWVDGTGSRDSVIPNNYPDFMSYCQSDDIAGNPAGQLPTKWISPYRWQALFGTFTTTTNRRMLERGGEIQTVYYVSGQLNRDGTGSLNPILVQPGIPTDPIVPGDEYAIEIQDASGTALSTIPFFVSFINVEGEEVDTVYFNYQLPEQPGTAKIVIKRRDQVLDEINVSQNAPTVKLTAPNGGESWSGTQTITWDASDPDDDPLRFNLLYTPDDGRSWFPIASNVEGNSFEVDTSLLPGGTQAKVRVIATDGFNTAEDDSDETFEVSEKGPDVIIRSPDSGTQFDSGQPITFQGDATDLEDAEIPDDSFIWSYGSTTFATGRQVSAVLPDGTHQVTLTVVDSNGNTGESTIDITVSNQSLIYLPILLGQ